MVVRKDKSEGYLMLRLTCEYCGGMFSTKRFRKYCSNDCSKQANRVRTGFKYREMRAAYYKAMYDGVHKKIKPTHK